MDVKEEFDHKLQNRFRQEETSSTEKGDWERMHQWLDAIDTPVAPDEIGGRSRNWGLVWRWAAMLLILVYPIAMVKNTLKMPDVADTEAVKQQRNPQVLSPTAQTPAMVSAQPKQEKQIAGLPGNKSANKRTARVRNLSTPNALVTAGDKKDRLNTQSKHKQTNPSSVVSVAKMKTDGLSAQTPTTSLQTGQLKAYLGKAVPPPAVQPVADAINTPKQDTLNQTANNPQISKTAPIPLSDSLPNTDNKLADNDTAGSKLPEKSLHNKPHHTWGVLAGAGYMYNSPGNGLQFGLELCHRYDKGHFFMSQHFGLEQNTSEHVVTSITQEYYFLNRGSRTYQLEVKSTSYLKGSFVLGYTHSNVVCYAGPVAGYLLSSSSSLTAYKADGERTMVKQDLKGYKNGLNEFTYGVLFGAEYVLGRIKFGSRIHYYRNYHIVSANNRFNDWQGYICYTLK